MWNTLDAGLKTLSMHKDIQSQIKVTVQFETEGNGQNEIFSHMDRSEVKRKIYCDISYTQRDFETEKLHRKWV